MFEMRELDMKVSECGQSMAVYPVPVCFSSGRRVHTLETDGFLSGPLYCHSAWRETDWDVLVEPGQTKHCKLYCSRKQSCCTGSSSYCKCCIPGQNGASLYIKRGKLGEDYQLFS